MIKIKLKDGSILSGSIDNETEETIWLDEDRAFGDIVVIYKSEIETLEEVK